jgi:tetratricopeptide (TPR) repeat protein
MGALVSGAVRLLAACLLWAAGHPAGTALGADPPAGGTPAGEESLETLWERGERAFEAGDLAAAERDFLAALSRDEHRSRSWNYLGGVHFAQGDLPRALEEFRRALAEDPRDVRACNNIGTALQRLGDFAGAEEHYLRAAAADPSYAPTQLNLGVLYAHRLARPEAARRAWRRYLELVPSGTRADEVRRELSLLESEPAPSGPGGSSPTLPP